MSLLKCSFPVNLRCFSEAKDILFIYLLFFLLGIWYTVSQYSQICISFPLNLGARKLFHICLSQSPQKSVLVIGQMAYGWSWENGTKQRRGSCFTVGCEFTSMESYTSSCG